MGDKVQINNGGPAFPLQSIGPDFSPGYAGMTLRDYFAAKALPSVIIASQKNSSISFDGDAEQAYKYADAMIKIRAAE